MSPKSTKTKSHCSRVESDLNANSWTCLITLYYISLWHKSESGMNIAKQDEYTRDGKRFDRMRCRDRQTNCSTAFDFCQPLIAIVCFCSLLIVYFHAIYSIVLFAVYYFSLLWWLCIMDIITIDVNTVATSYAIINFIIIN